MKTPNRLMERELAITKAYRDNYDADKSTRELEVLKVMLPTMFVAPHEGDLIAARIDRPAVGMFPAMEGPIPGAYTLDELMARQDPPLGIDMVGYAIDEWSVAQALKQIIADDSYDAAYEAAVREMDEFWRTECTNNRIRAQIPEEFKAALYTDDYNATPAVVHPLYRMAGGNPVWRKIYDLGIDGLTAELKGHLEKAADPEAASFYRALIGFLAILTEIFGLYAEDARAAAETETDPARKMVQEKIAKSCTRVMHEPPADFRDALQLQAVYSLCGRTVELARLDDYMAEIYDRSLREGTVTREEAVDLLENFFTIFETERGRDTRAIIGGYGRQNPALADQFDHVVLDVLERRKFRFYPQVSLRWMKGMDESIYTRSLELLGKGYTYPMLYNDEVNVPSVMRAFDVPRRIAEQYTFFGCGEFQLGGYSIGTPNSCFNIAKVVEITLNGGRDVETGAQWGPMTPVITDETSYEEFKAALKTQIDFFADACGTIQELIYDVAAKQCSFLQMSLLHRDCVSRGKPAFDGGFYHLGGTVETYGNITAYDSITAIRELVYRQKRLTIARLKEVLAADFQGYPAEQALLKNAPKFGNDDPAADEVAVEFHEYVCNAIRRQKLRTRLDSFLVVIINNSMNVTLGHFVGASADGRRAHTFLSNGNSPYAGNDHSGLPALVRSMTRMDNSIHACGNQNIKLSSEMFEGDMHKARSVIETFFEMGGQQINLSVVNQKDLEDAMEHPELHEDLVVRVGGFSACFVHLEPEIQRDILARTAY